MIYVITFTKLNKMRELLKVIVGTNFKNITLVIFILYY